MESRSKPVAITGGQVLIDNDHIDNVNVVIDYGQIIDITESDAFPVGTTVMQAHGSYVLPGIIDVHGDSFERQLMPRPGISIDTGIALVDSDRQLLVNGITTAFHGVTCSWEPGLRSMETLRQIRDVLNQLRDKLAVDNRLHLRFETFNTEAEEEINNWLKLGKVDLLAFNDHTGSMIAERDNTKKNQRIMDRTGLTLQQYQSLLTSVYARRYDVDAVVERLADTGKGQNLPMFSHDDRSPEVRQSYHNRACLTSEFPLNQATAEKAFDLANDVVVGAPNVVRGGSHIGAPAAADLIKEGIATIIASDYYYPAPLHAAYALVRDDIVSLVEAWSLVSANPARATGLRDRGTISCGKRADLLIVDNNDTQLPCINATIANGRVTRFH